MQTHAAAYEAWIEAERVAGSAERVLGEMLSGGVTPPDDLVAFAGRLRGAAIALLLKWFRALDEAASGMGSPN